MTADNKVDARRLLRKLHVLFIANMREGNNAINLLFHLKIVYCALDGCNGVQEFGVLAGLGNVGRTSGGDGNDGKIMLGENVVGNKSLVEDGMVGFNISTDDRKGEILDLILSAIATRECQKWTYKFSQNVVTQVKLVVPKSHGIKSQLVQDLSNFLRFVMGEEQSPLELVSRIQKQAVLLGRPFFLKHILYPRVSAITPLARICAVSARRPELIQMGVDVVDMVQRDVVVSIIVQETPLQLPRNECVRDNSPTLGRSSDAARYEEGGGEDCGLHGAGEPSWKKGNASYLSKRICRSTPYTCEARVTHILSISLRNNRRDSTHVSPLSHLRPETRVSKGPVLMFAQSENSSQIHENEKHAEHVL